jgi:cyclophilin family peptidyl-prolyl cis-trans isomerase
MGVTDVIKDNRAVFLALAGLVIVVLIMAFSDVGGGIIGLNTPQKYDSPPKMELNENKDYQAGIITNYGTIKVDLYEDLTPINVNNFVFLAENKFYDGLTFYKVIPNFIIQGGDPSGKGDGTAGYYVQDEIVSSLTFKPYVLAMARDEEKDTNSCQFFITLKGGDFSELNGKYTIIGEVISGQDVVDTISKVKIDSKTYKPEKKVLIKAVEIFKYNK